MLMLGDVAEEQRRSVGEDVLAIVALVLEKRQPAFALRADRTGDVFVRNLGAATGAVHQGSSLSGMRSPAPRSAWNRSRETDTTGEVVRPLRQAYRTSSGVTSTTTSLTPSWR